MWNEFIRALIRGKHHVFLQVVPPLISLFSELCNTLSTRKNASQVLQTNHESPAWLMRIVDERLWWHFWSVFNDVGALPHARRGHTRNDAHCRSHARNVLTAFLTLCMLGCIHCTHIFLLHKSNTDEMRTPTQCTNYCSWSPSYKSVEYLRKNA